jgi:molybdate transport system substrate-binding protein
MGQYPTSMGVYESVQAKTTRYPDGASVMEHLLKGKGREVGFGPITEILQFRDKAHFTAAGFE